MPSARTIAKPQERKEIALNAINRMQNQIKKPYYSHAAKYRPSSTETSNAGVHAETSSDPYNTEIQEGWGKIIPVSCNSQTKVKPGGVRDVWIPGPTQFSHFWNVKIVFWWHGVHRCLFSVNEEITQSRSDCPVLRLCSYTKSTYQYRIKFTFPCYSFHSTFNIWKQAFRG